MIIECINCNKKFEVNSNLIPDTGRTIQCGSCGHVWFFNKNDVPKKESYKKQIFTKDTSSFEKKKYVQKIPEKIKKSKRDLDKNFTQKANKTSALVKYQKKSNFTFSKFLSLTLVFLITLVAIIIVIDTFKSPLYDIFPKLETYLISLYETLKDIELFVRDLI